MMCASFETVEADHYSYVKKNDYFMILFIYVSDILLAGNNLGLLEETKKVLASIS